MSTNKDEKRAAKAAAKAAATAKAKAKQGGGGGGGGGGGATGGGGGGGGKDARRPADMAKPPPPFWAERLAVWDELAAKHAAELAARPRTPITVTLPDGKTMDAVANETTPLDIATRISPGLASAVVIARVDGAALWDCGRPLEADCKLELLKFDAPEAKKVFWHSSAHVLGQAIEAEFDASLCIGPPLDEEQGGGFYYDAALPGGATLSDADYRAITDRVAAATKAKAPFERLEIAKADALRMFAYNKYKQAIIASKVPDGETCTAYRCGPLIDLCRGPHVPDTGRVRALDVVKSSSAYWLGDKHNDVLQRVYGISFPDKKQLKAWHERRAEAERRDHRVIGTAQELFFFDSQLSAGSVFMLPHGARIYRRLVEYLRREYWTRHFTEVQSPNIFSAELWERSGHAGKYSENMFHFQTRESETFSIKPMNCPGHHLLFNYRQRSYRELPFRMAEFGVLHRNELSGSLGGLTRVRRFVCDDAHIYCRPSQVQAEIEACIDFMEKTYAIFGFEFDLELSTRPEQSLGDDATWERAEAELRGALEAYSARSGQKWKLNPGDGAFYGPKIDVHIKDALGRSHQCATIQLDFVAPIRFNLRYIAEQGEGVEASDSAAAAAAAPAAAAATTTTTTAAAADGGDDKAKAGEPADDDACVDKHPLPPGYQRPVIVHRAVYGSVERFLSILIEHTAGVWPLWINPRQVCVVPIMPANNAYAEQVRDRYHAAHFYVDADTREGSQLKKKIREAELARYSFILVVGAKEQEAGTVNVRTRGGEQLGVKQIDAHIAELRELCDKYQ